MSDQIKVWDYLHLLAVAMGRGVVKPRAAAIAQLVAMNGQRSTGMGCTVDSDRLADELGISRATVWRQVTWLIENGWLERTERPTQGVEGRAGRKARYRIIQPRNILGIELPKWSEPDQLQSQRGA